MSIRTMAFYGLLTGFFLLSTSVSFCQLPDPLPLSEGWTLQSSAKITAKGDVISAAGFAPVGWYRVSVPTTVVAAQWKAGDFSDPYFGMNLRQLPGMTYPIGANFSNLAMDRSSPYAVPWWYRKEVTVPAEFAGRTIWLNFAGINYRANIWVNGRQIANSSEVAGAWRTYSFNISGVAKPGAVNVVAVQVWPPTPTDLAITFVDWNPAPPDRAMGLWRDVSVSATGPVALRYPTVISQVSSDGDRAQLTVTVQLKNALDQPVHGTLNGDIEGVKFSRDVDLLPGEAKDVTLEPAQFPQLKLSHPRLWWPMQMGTPNLYDLHLSFATGGQISDATHTRFGIREITSDLDSHQRRVFSVNHKKILIRGGGWSPDLMLRQDPTRLRDEFRYVRDMGLNTIRLEGKLESEEFFRLADEQGILVMAGWCCCDHWEHWSKWKPADYQIAEVSLQDQIYRLRSHPSLLMWLNGSDNPPPANVEAMYLKVEQKLLWPNPIVSSATGKPASKSGDSGVKMTGPYEYVAPGYWQLDGTRGKPEAVCNPGGCGGAYGFNTETSMGPAVPPVESLRKMLPADHLWPIDEYWGFHAGGGEFKNLKVFTEALDKRYGKADSLDDYALKSQLMTYEGVRAMFEAYSRNKYVSTGVIQWMLNNAWPSVIWHLYDYYLLPGGGYFGAKTANQSLHPVYGYDDHAVWVVSSQYADANGLTLSAQIFDLQMNQKFSKQVAIDAPADSSRKLFELPSIPELTPTYFLSLRLTNSEGKLVGSNFYWLSTAPETLDWAKSNWWKTPTRTFANYTALANLPKVKLHVRSQTERHADDSITRVMLENPSPSLAFFIRLKVNRGAGGDEILPVIWEDNYLSLLPGEKREITATYRTSSLGAAEPAVEVKGWNVD